MTVNILTFDTATHACTVALKVGERVFFRHSIAPQQHAKLILPFIHALLEEAKIARQNLHVIAFGAGPGSFMGVRLATAIAQGLAFGLKIPVIALSTLQILAQTAHEKTGAKNILAGWDARLNEVYWGVYVCDEKNMMQPRQEDALCILDKIDREAWTALGFEFAGNIFSDDTYPDAKAMLGIAETKYLNNEFVSPENARPHYVRHHVVQNHIS